MDKLIFTRNFLFKFFIVGLIILIISAILYIFFKDMGAELAFVLYGVTPAFYFSLSTALFAYIKLFLFLFLLAPAIALHWTIKCIQKKEKEQS